MPVPTELIQNAVAHLTAALKSRKPPLLFAGPDGFMDEIIHVVDKRYDVNRFDPIKTIADYAKRLAEAAGKSTNVEFVVQQVKSGGNGPLMCEGFGRLGGRIHYVGSVGWPDVDPLFDHLKQFGEVQTIAPAAITLATEFEDGKIMHGKHQSLREVTWDNFVNRLGGEAQLDAALRRADAVAIINWTMVPFLNDVLRSVAKRVQAIGADAPQTFFFDLCDPEKRTNEDLLEALRIMSSFARFAKDVILGLNEKESQELCKAYNIAAAQDLIQRAKDLVQATGVTEIVIHPTRSAAAWSKTAQGAIEGPFCPQPKLTTGAGDHFNGGYVFARICGLPPEEALVIGKCVSGFYVRQGRGPAAEELPAFAERWCDGTLDK